MIPACERIYCPDIRELVQDTRLRVEPGNYEAGASYKFSCPVNYELMGPRYADNNNKRPQVTFLPLSSADCLAGGQWSLGALLPQCEAIICPAPGPPRHGSVHPGAPGPGQSQYRVGDIVKFHCDTGHMMSGETRIEAADVSSCVTVSGSPVAACTHTRAWSRPAPSCLTACTYPGTAHGGMVDKVTS